MNKYRTKFLIAIQVCSTVLLTIFTTASAIAQTSVDAPAAAYTSNITPPPVPENIKVPEQHKVFLVGHATGTQNYICLPSASAASGFDWSLFTPQATLFNDFGRQVTTHFFSLNPFESEGLFPFQFVNLRAAWQHSDTSTVWGQVTGSSVDPNFVNPGAVAWLRVEIVGAKAGPTGGNKLTGTTFIHRVNTVGGVKPSTGCSSSAEISNKAFVPYTADYFFYRDASNY